MESAYVGDLPGLLLLATDPAVSLVAAGILLRRLSGDARLPVFRPTEVEVCIRKDQGADDSPDSDFLRVTALPAYAPCGSLLLDMSGTSARLDAAEQSALVELAKVASQQRQVGVLRRHVLIHGVCRLGRPLQHALRKVIEDSCETALFVMTATRLGLVDAPLLGRALVMNCNPTPSGTDACASASAYTYANADADAVSAVRGPAKARAAAQRSALAALSVASRTGEQMAFLRSFAMRCIRESGELATPVVKAAASCEHDACLAQGDAKWALCHLFALLGALQSTCVAV